MLESAGRFHGMTFGAIRRNSTAGQRDNYAAQHQLESVEHFVAREGGATVLYDEQATSGRRLSKRAVARDLLEDVRAKVVDGIAVTVLDRLTRDELGKDAATIAEVLIEARALLVTLDQTFRLWNKDDLLFYKLKTGLAGHEVQGITERFWNGVFQKAKQEVFFIGPPPVGYTTRVEQVAGAGAGGRTKLRRVPIRDEAATGLMAAVATALDECACLGDAVARLNAGGHRRRAIRGGMADKPARWELAGLRYLINNPLYHGTWIFGRHSKRQSPIWDAMPTGIARRAEAFVIDCPELAWWPQPKMEAWRAKHEPNPGEPRRRYRSYERPLRGILACVTCGRLMVAMGRTGYCCPLQSTLGDDRACERPQTISEGQALKGLRLALNMAVAERADYRERLRAQLAGGLAVDARNDELVTLRDRLAGMEAQWYGDGAPAVVPDFAVRLMSEAQAKVNAITSEVDRDRRQGSLSAEDEQLFEALASDPGAVLATKTPGQQADVMRRALADVRLASTGFGYTRAYTVASFRNRLLRT